MISTVNKCAQQQQQPLTRFRFIKAQPAVYLYVYDVEWRGEYKRYVNQARMKAETQASSTYARLIDYIDFEINHFSIWIIVVVAIDGEWYTSILVVVVFDL